MSKSNDVSQLFDCFSTIYLFKIFTRSCSLKTSAVKGKGVYPVRTFKGGGVSSDADFYMLWCKNFRFFEIFVVFAWTKGEGG